MIAKHLPVGWKYVKLKDVAVNRPNAIVDGPFGSNLRLDDYVESGVPVLQGKNITNDKFKWFDVRYISEKKAEELKRSSVRINDILLIKIGSIGYSAIVESLNGFEFAIIPANLAKVTPNTEIVSTKYLHLWLTSPDSKRYLLSNASKTAQPALSLTKIKELLVPLPPLSEQRRIAAILDQADVLRAKRREALAQLDSLTQSIFLEMFGNPATNTMGWKKLSLERVALKITDGEHQTPQRTESGIKLLSARNIRDGFLDLENVDYINQEEYLRISKRCNPERGDILISCSGSIGRVAIVDVDEPLGMVRSAALVKPDHTKIRSKYLEYYLRTPVLNRLMVNSARSSSQANLFQGPIRALPILLPPLEIQDKFSTQIQAVNHIRAKNFKAIDYLNALFSSLQHRAFRGEL